MPPVAVAPTPLVGPGYLWIAPIGTAEPTAAVTAGKFSDTIPVAWLPLGATVEGTTFAYNTTVEPVMVAEFFDPIAYYTTERSGSLAFSMASWTLSNLRRAVNGGIAAIAPTGTSGQELASFEPPTPGTETRAMLLWQSDDDTVRLLVRRAISSGEVSMTMNKAPNYASIPTTWNMELPVGSSAPFKLWTAGTTRV